MLLSVNEIAQAVRENSLVKKHLDGDFENLVINTRSLINDCKDYWGLVVASEREASFNNPGRSEYLYKDTDLYTAIKKYLDGYGHYKMNKKKAISYALLEHLEFMGVNEEQSADMSPEAIRKRIFGIKD
jgi:hypothetical protein